MKEVVRIMEYNFLNVVQHMTELMEEDEKETNVSKREFTDETRKNWYIFLGYLRQGFNYKVGSANWYIIKNFEKSNEEIAVIIEKAKKKHISKNNVAVVRHTVNKELQMLFSDELFDAFLENNTDKIMCTLRMLVYRPNSTTLFIDEIADMDISREELYAATKVKDVLDQVRHLKKYTRNELSKTIENDVNPALLYYIIKKLDEDCIIPKEDGQLGRVNNEKLEILQAIGY